MSTNAFLDVSSGYEDLNCRILLLIQSSNDVQTYKGVIGTKFSHILAGVESFLYWNF